jgi:predicted DNA binding protein
MGLVDARVRVHHPCPYCDLSQSSPRTLLLLWCDNRRDVFLVSAPDSSELRRVSSALRTMFHGRTLLSDGHRAVVEVPDFEWSSPPSVTGMARRAGVWVLHPVVYSDGTETYRLLADSKARLNRLISRVRRLGDVELLSVNERSDLTAVRDQPTATVHFFEGLTNRQAESLVAAFDGGLYDVPVRSSWASVARRLGLSRSTFGEHLRKGQRRLLVNSYASLRARSGTSQTPLLLPATRPPGGHRRPKSRRRPSARTRASR